jgi:hypothetical protein
MAAVRWRGGDDARPVAEPKAVQDVSGGATASPDSKLMEAVAVKPVIDVRVWGRRR